MQPVSVDAALLRALLTTETGGDLTLSLGRVLMARVAAEQQGAERGLLSLAGTLIQAELPDNLKAGDELRLQVSELSQSKVVLTLQQDPAALLAQPPPAEPPSVPMPAGGSLRVAERDARRASGGAPNGTHRLSLRYDAPNLGAIDMAFTLTPTGLTLALTVPAGGSHARTRAAADALSRALGDAAQLPVTLTIAPRHEPLEVFA